MRGKGLGLAASWAALAVLLAGQGTGAAVLMSCATGSAPDALTEVRAQLQDDAASGRDAGDCAAQALGLPGDGYHWGFLEAAGAPGLNDLEDWYAVDLLALFGPGSWVLLNATADTYSYVVPVPPLPHLRIVVELWAPGAREPAHTASSCGDGASFANEVPGIWNIRVRHEDLPPGLPCTAPPNAPAPNQPAPGQDYGFYLGCHPFCANA